MTTASDITGATNASPIVITSTAHGRSDDTIIVVHDVGGNTAADGTWKVANADTDTFELYGSTGNTAYTSGGKFFDESTTFSKITKKRNQDATLGDKAGWYPRGRNVVIDKFDFSNDILVEYIASPDSVDDIPAEYHTGLVSFGVIHLISIPAPEDKRYADLARSMKFHTDSFERTISNIRRGLRASTEASDIAQSVYWDGGFE